MMAGVMEQSLDIKITPFNLIKFALPTVIAQIFMGIYSIFEKRYFI